MPTRHSFATCTACSSESPLSGAQHSSTATCCCNMLLIMTWNIPSTTNVRRRSSVNSLKSHFVSKINLFKVGRNIIFILDASTHDCKHSSSNCLSAAWIDLVTSTAALLSVQLSQLWQRASAIGSPLPSTNSTVTAILFAKKSSPF